MDFQELEEFKHQLIIQGEFFRCMAPCIFPRVDWTWHHKINVRTYDLVDNLVVVDNFQDAINQESRFDG